MLRGRSWIVVSLALFAAARGASAEPVATPAWYSGFEQGFPGEFTDYDDGALTDQDVPNPGKTAAWSIVGADKFPEVLAGDSVYKGWITGEAMSSHRAYPVLHTEIPTPLVNSFWVWLDVDYDKLDPVKDWVHFGTWGNNADWKVHTMSVLDRKIHLAHLVTTDYVGPMPQPDFPLRQWVRLTVYLHYPEQGNGTVCVWQDGVSILTGEWKLPTPGTSLLRTHWGMYAASSVDHGVQYNDEIQIWTLSEPLPGCDVAEPVSPYPQPGDTGGESSGGESSGGESSGGETSTGGPDDTGEATTGEATTGEPPAGTTTTSSGGGEPTTGGPSGGTTGAGESSGGATTDNQASAGDGGGGEAGCGCRSNDAPAGLLGLALLGLIRRRRA